MNERIKRLRDFFIVAKSHHSIRQPKGDVYILLEKFKADNVSALERATQRILHMLSSEVPVLFEDERIAFTRTVSTVPEIFTDQELETLKESHWIHELGDVSNINVDYTMLMSIGFDAMLDKLKDFKTEAQGCDNSEKADYHDCQIRILEAVLALTRKYQKLADDIGNKIVAESLKKVPRNPPKSFLEALQMFRIIHFTMWLGRNYHNTVGRFDQFMLPYFEKDMASGVLNEASALELLEEFFLTFNRDSDLYPGMQQGDNGQSIVLGGLNVDGSDSYNLLSELCLNTSLNLKLIDPKINLRVHKNTPLEVYTLGSKLTKQGLGFPQYSNDDVVIPGLIKLGYEEKDAYNYAVAACWEFIIPRRAMDVPNIEALSFAGIVNDAVHKHLKSVHSFKEFVDKVKENITDEIKRLCESAKNLYIFPAPFLSLMTEDSTERGVDISLGNHYNNYGIHGTGIATAVDSLAAIKKVIFTDKSYTSDQLIDALENDYENYEELQAELRFSDEKMGNNIAYVDELASELLNHFSMELKNYKNDRGGVFRAGTGSAMYYIWHSKNMPATPDGRNAGEGLAANYSPSLFIKSKGPVSILKSFTRPKLENVINGGPLTLELHDSIFRSDESIEKVGILVKSFMDLGGHQLQLNAVNREKMLAAQLHPENYQNLIVRVWGWSGYFVELDKEYQDHIIQRIELME